MAAVIASSLVFRSQIMDVQRISVTQNKFASRTYLWLRTSLRFCILLKRIYVLFQASGETFRFQLWIMDVVLYLP